MAINSKAKGKNGELEVAHILKEYGFEDARRTAQYCGNTGDASDVVGMEGYHLEVKRNERLNIYEAVEQSIRDARDGELPVVIHRKNRKPWLITMTLEDYMERVLGRSKDG